MRLTINIGGSDWDLSSFIYHDGVLRVRSSQFVSDGQEPYQIGFRVKRAYLRVDGRKKAIFLPPYLRYDSITVPFMTKGDLFQVVVTKGEKGWGSKELRRLLRDFDDHDKILQKRGRFFRLEIVPK